MLSDNRVNKMRLIGLIILAIWTNHSIADDRRIVGNVVELRGSSLGIHIRLDTGLPVVCSSAPSSFLLIPVINSGGLHLISDAKNKRVILFADFDSEQLECVAKVISMN